MTEYITRDSGERVAFDSGMVRDVQTGKPRYDLIPLGPLKRLADLYARGAEKYGDANWQKANSDEEIQRFKGSAFRHFMQFLNGEVDEDHGIAVCWNIFALLWLEETLEANRQSIADAVRGATNVEPEDDPALATEWGPDHVVLEHGYTQDEVNERLDASKVTAAWGRAGYPTHQDQWGGPAIGRSEKIIDHVAKDRERIRARIDNKLGLQKGIQFGGAELPTESEDGSLGER